MTKYASMERMVQMHMDSTCLYFLVQVILYHYASPTGIFKLFFKQNMTQWKKLLLLLLSLTTHRHITMHGYLSCLQRQPLALFMAGLKNLKEGTKC